MQLASNCYELHCYVSNFIYNNHFLANFEMSQSLPFIMNMFLSNFWRSLEMPLINCETKTTQRPKGLFRTTMQIGSNERETHM